MPRTPRSPLALAAVPTAVYRWYDARDRLLYVGITDEPKRRWQRHAKLSAWWPDAVRRVMVWYDDRPTAELEEKRAIAEESPVHNKVGKPKPPRTRFKNSPRGQREDRVSIRINPDDWERFDAAAKSLGFRSRNAYLSAVIDWVLHKPTARTPKRPPKPDA